MYRVRFSNFWPNFNKNNNIFLYLLKHYGNFNYEVIIDTKSFVDLEIRSVFYHKNAHSRLKEKILAVSSANHRREYYTKYLLGYSEKLSDNAAKTIWYTGENRRPPVDLYTATLSFDPSDDINRNIFLPYWLLRMKWSEPNPEYEMNPEIEKLLIGRKHTVCERKAVSFSNMLEPNRLRVVNAVERCMPVLKYGKVNGNAVESKFNAGTGYALQICTENDIYPDYVTEKLQEAWLMRNVPVWSGLDKSGFFNPRAIIDVTGLRSEEIIEKISRMSMEELYYIQSQPILVKIPDLGLIANRFLNYIS